MAVRYITYEWSNISKTNNATPEALTAGQKYDIFTGSVGNSLTIPARANSTEFIVVEDLGITPTKGGSMQLSIGTTDYFVNPDGTTPDGIPAEAAPYPCGAASSSNTSSGGGVVSASVSYTLYDGPDSLIANKLLEMGVPVSGSNVDWYKQQLLEKSIQEEVQ